MGGRGCRFSPALAPAVLGLCSDAVRADKFLVQITLGGLRLEDMLHFCLKNRRQLVNNSDKSGISL